MAWKSRTFGFWTIFAWDMMNLDVYIREFVRSFLFIQEIVRLVVFEFLFFRASHIYELKR